jgi:multidrug efflux pump subunit AcrA (membrane-fusion protein)
LNIPRISGLTALLLASAIVSGCALLPATKLDRSTDGNETPTPIPTAIVPIKPTYTVKRGEIVDELEFSGRVAPVVEEDLFFRNSGRVRAVFNKRNDFVEEGQVLAELEIDPLERELESAELDLERAKVRLQQAIDEHEYQLTVAQTDLDMANIRLDSMRSEAVPDQTQIALQEKEIELKQLALDRLNEGIDPLLESDVERAQLDVTKLKADIADSQIIAPFAGQLLSYSLTPGQAVDAYKAVASIADVNELEVSADLISNQLTDLSEGMPAKFMLVSRPGVELTGTIRRLPYPYGSGGKGTTVEEMDKSTRITVNEDLAEYGIELGDLIRVQVELERKDDVLWLPPQAIRLFEGRRFVVLKDGDVQRRVDIEVGIETQERVEIEEGLEEGQVVVGQ